MKKHTLPILGLLLLSWLTASGQRVEVSTGLPGLLSGLSVGNGGGVVTNLAFPQTYWFTNQGITTNWMIPTGARSLFLRAIGPGGAGGSGRRYSAGTIASGGAGGGGGAYGELIIGNVANLPALSLTIVIPDIRTGGAAVTTDDSNGTNGASVGTTIIYAGNSTDPTNYIFRVQGGLPGGGGDADGVTGGSGGSVGTQAGSNGGASSTTGAGGGNGASLLVGYGGTGGGGGGGITTGATPSTGGSSGVGPSFVFNTTASPGGAIAANGTNFPASGARVDIATITLTGWQGAGGGGSSTNSAGGNGANGYGWGSGGGGGGASLNGFASGKGGDGGPSAVSITVY